jgi:cation-transporting P-type ATPase E
VADGTDSSVAVAQRFEPSGLGASEVAARLAEGRVNAALAPPVRTLGEIIRANVLTWVNAIIGILFVLVLVAGRPADGLFVGIILSNSVIGILQEVRARRALQELAVLNAPRAHVRRSGADREVAVGEVVADEVLVVRPGDQLVVDGQVIEAAGLEVDESLLTGEADPIGKGPGDQVLSGSFVVAGSGYIRATRIGAESYASTLAEEARRFHLAASGLRADVDRVLRWQILIIPPIAVLLFIRQLHLLGDWRDAVIDTVAATSSMVPAGLALLISIAFIVGVLELSRRRALAKELASVELLARVDTLCLDKTGTLTTGEISLAAVEPLSDVDGVSLGHVIGALVAADPNPNPTLAAIGTAHPPRPGWAIDAVVRFSSARKWAGVLISGHGAYHLGAPEVLLDGSEADGVSATVLNHARGRVAAEAEAGRRVLVVTRSGTWSADGLPLRRDPIGLVLLEDTVRSDVPEILEYFRAQRVTLKVISGDNPRTVAAVAARAGVPNADRWVDARELPDDPDSLADELDKHAVFGRVTPHQKRAMVKAMQSRGHVVAMTGDGVNDVLALKDADMGIAMGTGSAASRAVADLVLLDNQFSTLPVAVGQGRRVINNIERVANLFLTKTAYAVTLTLLVGLFGTPFPFLPRQQTLIDTFSIGLPGVVLALASDASPIRPSLLRRVLSFALPAGFVVGVATFMVYEMSRHRSDVPLDEARTSATLTLLGLALVVLVLASRPLATWKALLAGAMAASYLLIMAIGPLSEYFQLKPPAGTLWWTIGVGVVAGGAVIVGIRVATDRLWRPSPDLEPKIDH